MRSDSNWLDRSGNLWISSHCGTAHANIAGVDRRPPLVFLFTVTLTGILNNTLVTPAIPDILEEFGAPSDRAGLVVAAGSVAGIVVAPIGGFLADRFGRRIVLTVALTVFGVFGGLAAFAPSLGALVTARFLMGLGSASLVNLAVVLIGDFWSGSERTRLIGRNSAVLTVGLAAIPLLSGALTEAAGWRVTFGLYTISLGTAAAAWLILGDHRPVSSPSARDQFRDVLVVLGSPILRASILSGLLVFIAIFGLFLTVLPVHLAEDFGMEAAARGLMLSLPAVTATLASYNLGRMRQLFSPRSVVVISAVILGIAYLLIGLATTLAFLVVAVLIYGVSEGFFIPMLQDLNIEAAPSEHRAVVIAVWVGFARLGQTIGPLLAGLSIGLIGTGPTFIVGSSVGLAILGIGLFGPFPASNRTAAIR